MPRKAEGGEENFSLGVTALLDELLAKSPVAADSDDLPAADEDAFRRTFQRTADLCSEVQAYFDLVAREEAKEKEEVIREAVEKRSRAERRLEETLGASGTGWHDALEAN